MIDHQAKPTSQWRSRVIDGEKLMTAPSRLMYSALRYTGSRAAFSAPQYTGIITYGNSTDNINRQDTANVSLLWRFTDRSGQGPAYR